MRNQFRKDILWTPAPTYGFVLDKAVIFTTLKQGTTYLSKTLYNGLRPRYQIDYNVSEVLAYDHTDNKSDWSIETINSIDSDMAESYINTTKEYSLIEINKVVTGESEKDIIFLIRNPFSRIISSAIEDTFRHKSFLTNERKEKLTKIYSSYNLPEPNFEFKNGIWFIGETGKQQREIIFHFALSEWFAGIEQNGSLKSNHFISQWESFVFSMIHHSNIKKSNVKIIDVDDINIKDIVTSYLRPGAKLNISEKKIHKISDDFKTEFVNYVEKSNIMLDKIKNLIKTEMWFYNILKNKITQE